MGLCQQGLGFWLPIHRYSCATGSPTNLVPSCRVPEEATHLPPWFLIFSSWFSTSSEIESKKGRLAVPPKCSCIPLSHPRPAPAHPSPVLLLNPRHQLPKAPAVTMIHLPIFPRCRTWPNLVLPLNPGIEFQTRDVELLLGSPRTISARDRS